MIDLSARGPILIVRVIWTWSCADVARAWRRAGVALRARWEDVRRARRAGTVVRRTVRAGLARTGLGIILMCKFDLWGNAHVF